MKIKYRPEIDGLRAIAVFAVIFYHFDLRLFGKSIVTGGFLGVDIFFVISGYLITSIIINEINKTNKFIFLDFFERRIRRILPPLLFLLFICFLIAYLVLLPEFFIKFSESSIASLFFFSNFYFYISGQEYGAQSFFSIPLLHTWSLSVEEQFYLFFPFIFIIIFKYCKKHSIFIISLIIFLSFAYSIWLSFFNPQLSFLSLQSRIWQLLLGSIVAIIIQNNLNYRSKFKFYKIIEKVFPKLGILLILYSIIFFNKSAFYPSYQSLFAVLGTILIILANNPNNNDFVLKILSSKIFVFFGLISYSLYLWHYPIVTFWRINTEFNTLYLYKILLVVVILLLSIFSYFFIEKLFRSKKIISKKLLYLSISLFFVCIFSVNFYVIKNDGLNHRMPAVLQKKLKNDKSDVLYNKTGNKGDIVLLGDSHAEAIALRLSEKLDKKFNLHRFYSQFYVENFDMVDRKTSIVNDKFYENNENIKNFLNKKKNLTIIFHFRYTANILETLFDNEEGYTEFFNPNENFLRYYLSPRGQNISDQKDREIYITNAISNSIKNILNNGHKLILIYPVPELGFKVPKRLYKEFFLNKYIYKKDENLHVNILSTSYEIFKKRNEKIFSLLDSFENKNIFRIYPHRFLCNTEIKNRCIGNSKENIYYYDDSHLSIQGSEFIVDELIQIILKIKP